MSKNKGTILRALIISTIICIIIDSCYIAIKSRQNIINMNLILGSSVLIIFGLLCIILPILLNQEKKNRCKIPVIGTIIRVESRTKREDSGAVTLYSPVYEFIYNGEKREHRTGNYNNIEKYKVGNTSTLFINSYDIEDIYIKDGIRVIIFKIIFGLLFILFGIAMMMQ